MNVRSAVPIIVRGGERDPVILVAFKAIDPVLRGQDGGFDSHTLPPTFQVVRRLVLRNYAGLS